MGARSIDCTGRWRPHVLRTSIVPQRSEDVCARCRAFVHRWRHRSRTAWPPLIIAGRPGRRPRYIPNDDPWRRAAKRGAAEAFSIPESGYGDQPPPILADVFPRRRLLSVPSSSVSARAALTGFQHLTLMQGWSSLPDQPSPNARTASVLPHPTSLAPAPCAAISDRIAHIPQRSGRSGDRPSRLCVVRSHDVLAGPA